MLRMVTEFNDSFGSYLMSAGHVAVSLFDIIKIKLSESVNKEKFLK